MPRKQKQTSLPSLLQPLLFALAFVYFTFHALHGERGIYAWIKELHSRDVLQQQLIQTRTEREQLEKKVAHLRDESLDLDLLDEQMRRMFGEIRPDEKVVILPVE